MKIKSLILICISFVCVAGHVAVAQSTWPPCGHTDIQSPNQHSNVYATHNTDRITSTNQLSRVGSLNVDPMATTTYDQDIHITNRRNEGDPFGGGTLPENPIEPGTPIGDVPVLMMILLALIYAIRKHMKRIFLSLVTLLIAVSTYAVPARPGWQTKVQPDGTTIEVRLTGDEFYHYWQDRSGNVVKCDSLGYWRVVESQPTPATIKARRQASRMLQSHPNKAVGAPNLAPRGLVILVNFSNSKFANANNQVAMNELMNSDNYTYNGATGSVRKFFSDQSDGQYIPDFDVIGPVTLSENVAHYGGNDASGNDVLPGDMVVEACSIANASHGVDFTQYDNDGDGYVDFVYIVYAGKGEADGGADETIWPHNWDLESAYYYDNCTYNKNKRRFDGKYINNYACSGELDGSSGKRAGIGTIAHEFGHVIGLPDLYDIDYGQNYDNEMTPGSWHIMDGGSYNNEGRTPPNYTIYDKYFLGWKTPTNPGNTAQTLTLQAAGTDGYNAYQITSGNSRLDATSTTTAYYIENRQQTGWDAYLPGHGLVIWKIMYSQSVWEANGPNATPGTIRYAVVSASGKTTGIGTGADPFPGTKKVTRWEGVTNKPLLNITESGGIITLTYIDDAECHSVLTSGTACTITPSSDCVANGATLTANITPADASYDITSVSVQLGSTTLTKDTHYTLSNNNQFITIKGTAITGDEDNTITITATATKNRWNYEVLYENATVSSESGAVAKGGTLTLTVTPALGYILTASDIQVKSTDGENTYEFTYEGTTLTIANVTTDLAIYITPSIDPENAITFTRLTNTAMLQAGAKCILVYAETPAVAGQLMNNTYLASVTDGFTVNGTEITTQKTNTNISIFTLGGSTGTWTLTNSEGKKLSGTEKTLVWDGTNSTWTITVGDDGKTIMTVGGTQLYYNSSAPRFRTYTSAQKGLYLYVSQTGEIVKQDPDIKFKYDGNQTTKVNQPFSNPATSTYGTVTYSSSDDETATVNSSGVVTPKKAGTVTITASVAEGTYNNAASASYQLTITALATYTVTWMANGSQFAKVTYTEGNKLALPTETPAACSNTKQFVGWIATNDYHNDTQAPEFISAGEEVTANATYYAVYALEKTGSANVVTTTMTNFTATSANMDTYISYAAAKGGAQNDPFISNGVLRIYQNGGTLTVTAKTGAKINSITIGSSMATSVTYKADAGSTSAAQSISANGTFTESGLDASSVLFTCKGTTTSSRLYLNRLEVTYTAGTTTTYIYYSTNCSGEIDLTTAPTLEFADANKVLTIGDTYTNELECNSTGAKTFTSSDVNVATVNETNGQVTALAAGNTTITVAVAAVAGKYSAATASYNITVVRKKATPSFAEAQIDLKTGESKTVEVNKGEHDGEVAYTSADPAIATVDPVTGQVLGVSAGFTTITATLAQTVTYETATATYMVYVSSEMVSDEKLGVTWIADGVVLTDTEATHRYNNGDPLQMPSTEVGGTNGKEFVGWTTIKDYQNPFCPPADLFDTAEGKKVTANITYYAVYKTK